MHNSRLEAEHPTARRGATAAAARRGQQQQQQPQQRRAADGAEVLAAVAALVTEGRVPAAAGGDGGRRFCEGPHCAGRTAPAGKAPLHRCDAAAPTCKKFENNCEKVSNLYQKGIPLCIEVFFTCVCKRFNNTDLDNLENAYLLEQWHFNITPKRNRDNTIFNLNQLVTAIRSQLYFSQIIAWLLTEDSSHQISKDNIQYRLTAPGQALAQSKFFMTANKHEFPITNIDNGDTLSVSFFAAPRTLDIPVFDCTCSSETAVTTVETQTSNDIELNGLLDDRMHTMCTLKGKHRCEDFEDLENVKVNGKLGNKRICNAKKEECEASTSKNYFKPKVKITIGNSSPNVTEKRNISPNIEKLSKSPKLDYNNDKSRQHKNDLNYARDKGQLLLDAIERSGKVLNGVPKDNSNPSDCQCVQKDNRCATNQSVSDNANCDMRESDIFSVKEKNSSFNVYVDKHCDSPTPLRRYRICDISNIDITKLKSRKGGAKQKITFDDTDNVKNQDNNEVYEIMPVEVPTLLDKAKFRKNLDNAAQMVFHAHTGLPLTSSPAPVRKGKSSFDFDSSLNSVSAIKSALFSSCSFTDDESESDGSLVSPCSPEVCLRPGADSPPVDWRKRRGRASNLLGSFEESVLNGRLEPVSTVHGFTAELGASGSFVPKHMFVPVTVFFYTLGDNDKVSSPYLGHINLGKKGYNVPKSGTVQVTLFNPLGTVVKMFVIMYDLSDMPPNSQTFIRQRTLYMPTNCEDTNLEWGPKWLRYLIHLRFMSSKSGKIYLHSDIRMIIFRKCDMDTATAHGIDISYELRSFTHMPTNPRFSPRK